jgi:hypothetical protein
MNSTVLNGDTASWSNCDGCSRSEINGKTIMGPSTVVSCDNKETKKMTSTVVKRDTASRGFCRGSSRSEINRESIMNRSTVGNSSSEEMTVMCTTVVRRDSAIHGNCIGSGRSLINGETIMRRSTLLNGNKAAAAPTIASQNKRGFQHVYRSNTKPSSKKVRAAYHTTVVEGKPKTKAAVRRDKQKRKKMERLMIVSRSTCHARIKSLFATGKPIYFCGKNNKEEMLRKVGNDAHVLSAIQDLDVVDTVTGARMMSPSGDTVFTLVPRMDSIEKLTRVERTLASLYALEGARLKAEVRGKARIPVAEDDGKYTTVGLKPSRSCKGIFESWPKNLRDEDRSSILKLMTNCEEVAKGFVQADELRGLRVAQLMGNWPNLKGVSSRPIWGSLACGRNYYLNSHLDEDFFYSLTTIASKWGLRNDIDRYSMEAEVCNYFTFAEEGIAVALRPGDMLLFNPLYQHCLSSRTSNYENKDVFCLSLYLKTAVVGGNDNSVE